MLGTSRWVLVIYPMFGGHGFHVSPMCIPVSNVHVDGMLAQTTWRKVMSARPMMSCIVHYVVERQRQAEA